MSEPIRVAVIGTGFGQAVQIPAFQAFADTEVVAVISGRKERAEEAAKKFGIKHAFDDYRRALELDEVDAVSVVAPPHLHHQMTLDAFSAGKHVLCEKPMAMNLSQASEMVDAWRKSGKVGMINHEFRYVPARHHMRTLIQDGYIGDVVYGNITTFSSALAASKGRPFGWLFQEETGGGFLGALGSHAIDGIRYWFGELQSVTGFTQTVVPERKDPASGEMRTVTADDGFAVYARLENGIHASIISFMAAGGGGGNRYEAYGTSGMLVVDNENRLWGTQDGGELAQIDMPDEATRPDLGVDNPRVFPQVKLVERFARGIRSGATEDPTFADGAKVQAAIDAVRQSQKEHRWIDIA